MIILKMLNLTYVSRRVNVSCFSKLACSSHHRSYFGCPKCASKAKFVAEKNTMDYCDICCSDEYKTLSRNLVRSISLNIVSSVFTRRFPFFSRTHVYMRTLTHMHTQAFRSSLIILFLFCIYIHVHIGHVYIGRHCSVYAPSTKCCNQRRAA